MNCNTNFNDFISKINVQQSIRDDLKKSYETLDKRLHDHPVGKHVITTFMQGSMARNTAVKAVGDDKADIDIVVVTDFIWTDDINNTDPNKKNPDQALDAFKDFLNKYYPGKWRKQGRSLGITMSDYSIDLVPTALPSNSMQQLLTEAFRKDTGYFSHFLDEDYMENNLTQLIHKHSNWRDEYLMIPDRKAHKWDQTHPIAQIQWTNEKHKNTNKTFKKVVRAFKWWNNNFVGLATIKSYPLEHFIGVYVLDYNYLTLEEAIYEAFNAISKVSIIKPKLPDIGVPEHDVFARVTQEDYEQFITQVRNAAKIASQAYYEQDKTESSKLWQKIFGNEFPVYRTPTSSFTDRKGPSIINSEGRFA